jgi:hypothetical protein
VAIAPQFSKAANWPTWRWPEPRGAARFQRAEVTSNLPFASSFNIHEQIYAWRRVLVEWHKVPLAKIKRL